MAEAVRAPLSAQTPPLSDFVDRGALTDEQAAILQRLAPGPVDWSAAPPLRIVSEHTRFAVELRILAAEVHTLRDATRSGPRAGQRNVHRAKRSARRPGPHPAWIDDPDGDW